jgi:hypothetical protein
MNNLRKIILETIKEEMGGVSPIRKFVQFGYNYPHNFIKEIWGDTVLAKHLEGKFSSYYDKVGPEGVMSRFYTELDYENSKMLEDYIMSR